MKEPMFFGQSVNVARYDQQKYEIFEKLIEKQLSFFWRPEEVDVSQDRIDYQTLPEHEKHIFISNLKYQTLLDSIQGRSPNVALLPLVSIPELETWIETWSFSETIHSRSYTHIIRNIVNNPSVVFDDIVANEYILKRARDIAFYYDDVISYTQLYNQFGEGTHMLAGKEVVVSLRELKKKLYLCLMVVNVLEAIRFYVSFACSFAFAERELMEGNAKIIKLIARDEALHLTGTQHMLNILRSGEDDPQMAEIANETRDQCFDLFKQAALQEKEWAEYLFKGGSMIGLNKDILCQYVEYITNLRMQAVGLPAAFPGVRQNPIPWINAWLSSDNVQVAPQEVEISSYLIGQIDSQMNTDDLQHFEL
jgi:ribonucleoside-diphosphate reductase beta chain